jgi:hypothetical protein
MNTTEILTLATTYLAAISLATERFVAIVKSIIPWLAEERKDANGLIDVPQERSRSLIVLIISLLGAWITTSLLNDCFDPTAAFCFGKVVGHCLKVSKNPGCWPAGIVALLSTGGSAFWNNVLGFLTAVKDTKRQQRAMQRMELVRKSRELATPIDKVSKL